ncbi:hypothetical protein [Cohnella panacarvi]|uniref:hypothetical protein n=1 Tax=Cohnella panacarvi TaxID=400776 RepID=UPI0004791883|nr:hypothetical protein [Cohnella panacarvi]
MYSSKDIGATIQSITARAVIDKDFRALCLEQPKAAYKQATGFELPSGFRLRIVDNAGADYTLVLPDPRSDEDELEHSDLERTTGGIGASGKEMSEPSREWVRDLMKRHRG